MPVSAFVFSLLCMFIPEPLLLAAPTSPGTITRQIEQSEQHLKQQEIQSDQYRVLPEINTNKLSGKKKKAIYSHIHFKLNDIEINTSAILTASDIDAITQAYIGRIITFNDLHKLVAKINKLYRIKGYLVAKAILPPQKISRGIVKIRLIEARIGTLNIQGNKSTNKSYIFNRLALSSGNLVNIKKLEKKLDRFNLLNDIQVAVALKPGKKAGRTDYLLRVREPEKYQSFAYIDNVGTRDVGLYRTGFNFINRSLSGNRDPFTLGGYYARGTRAVYSSYKWSVNHSGTSANISGSYSTIRIIDGPIQPLDITGTSYNISAGLSHPFYFSKSSFMTGSVGVNKKESTTDSVGVTLFKTPVNTVYAGIERKSFSPDSISYANIIVTVTPEGWSNEKHFFKLNANYSYNEKMENEWLGLFRLGGQWSDTSLLPSIEQFQIGGIYTVRGYTEGLLIGDKGYFVSAELSHPVADRIKKIIGENARYLIFLDHGGAVALKGNGQGLNRDDFLTSIGIGLDFNFSSVISVHVIAGKPLVHRSDGNSSGRVNFNLQARF